MSSLHRELDGDVRIHHLTQNQGLIDPSLLARHGRSARTLVKEGPLRLTIVAIGPGGILPAHSTERADHDPRARRGSDRECARAGICVKPE